MSSLSGNQLVMTFSQVFLTTPSQPVFVVIVVVKKPFSFSTSLTFKASSSSRILGSFSDFSRGNSVTSAPLLRGDVFSLFFYSLHQPFFPTLGNASPRLFCELFLRSCCYKILSLILLVSRSEISSNSTPSSVGLGDAPLAFAFSLLCNRNLQSSKSNLSLTVH